MIEVPSKSLKNKLRLNAIYIIWFANYVDSVEWPLKACAKLLKEDNSLTF